MKLFKTFSTYTIIGFLNAGIGFLLLPVLTRYLTPSDYGIISLMNTYVLILMPIVGLSTSSFISVEYYNSKIPPDEFKRLFSSIRLIPALVIVPLALIFLLGKNWLPSVMELPSVAYWMLLPLTLFALYQEDFRSFLVISKRIMLFSTITLGRIFIEIPLTIVLVVYVGMNWKGRIDAWLVTVIFFSFLSIYFYKKWKLLSFNLSKNYIRQSVIFGAPLILHELGKFVINQSDRIFLAKMVSVNEMGIYSVGYQVGMIILIVNTAFANFFTPFLYERLNRNTENDKIEIVRLSYYYVIGLFILLLVLTLLTPSLFAHFISTRFARGTQYVFWVGLSYFFWGVYLIFAGYIFYLKKSKILGRLSVMNVLMNIGFNFLFIKRFGAIGAAYATCLSFFIVSVIVTLISQKLYPMPWGSWRKIFNF
jgi:O-antigen/teichoic acid export membrane protein